MNATTAPPEGSCPQTPSSPSRSSPCCTSSWSLWPASWLNGMSGWVFFYVPSSKSFIVYLKNIVIADFLMSLTSFLSHPGGLGPEPLAGTSLCVQGLGRALLHQHVRQHRVLLFGLIGFDRYYKIVKPLLTSFIQSISYSKLLSVLVWSFTLLIALPNMILTNRSVTEATRVKCADLKSHLGLKWHKASSYIFVGIF